MVSPTLTTLGTQIAGTFQAEISNLSAPATRAVTASLLRVSGKLVPPREEIGKAGAKIEDQDAHRILFG
jgi:hypothetical protein